MQIIDEYFANQWNLKLMNVPAAWEYTQGAGAVVGIIDSGVDGSHIDLGWETMINITAMDGDASRKIKYQPVMDAIRTGKHPKILQGWNYIEGNDDTWDLLRHGTYLAGTICADMDGIGMIGVAPLAKIRPYVVIDGDDHGQPSDIAKAILQSARDGCDVINISLAMAYETVEMKDAIDWVSKNTNAIIIAATGNNNSNSVYYPAAYENVIAVGGCNPVGERWVHNAIMGRGSNYGSEMLCVAPGASQMTTFRMRWRYTESDGTSQACANMSGVIALLKSVKKNLTFDDVVNLIKKNSSKTAWDKELGYGVPDTYRMVKELATQKPKLDLKDIAKQLSNIAKQLSDYC